MGKFETVARLVPFSTSKTYSPSFCNLFFLKKIYAVCVFHQVEENPDVAKKINGVIAWHVGDQKWVADLKEGRVYEGQ